MSGKPCPKCGRSNSVVKSAGGYRACDTCNYEEPMSETMTETTLPDLLRQLNMVLSELPSWGSAVTVREVKGDNGPGVIILIDNAALHFDKHSICMVCR